MKYVSTRGNAPVLSFDEVLLAGLARDGGLYLPESWPQFSADDLRALRGLPYPELAARVMKPFIAGSCLEDRFDLVVAEAYSTFEHSAVVPLKQLDSNLWLLELFHGPTLAFKDVALQLLGCLFEEVLKERNERITIVGATSGDTGSAAIEACRGREMIDIFILHPEGRTSDVQRRQMTTVQAANVHNIAIKGTFDDCQDLVKGLFNDQDFRDEVSLSAVNSINWARIMAQIVYYVAGAVALGAPDREVAFTVPTGNFGNVFAGYAAKAMGVPIKQFVVGSNSNDILTRFFNTGRMEMQGVAPTLSPSMDIQVSSNFERLLFELHGRDAEATTQMMTEFRETGSYQVSDNALAEVRQLFDGHRLDDRETLSEISQRFAETSELLDPHSAVGTASAEAQTRDPATPMISLATAHPAKFPDAVEKATGRRPGLPDRLADLFEREERYKVMENDLTQLQNEVREQRA
ncbi:threonine synthase [Rhodovibrionaceae bacterium A322]